MKANELRIGNYLNFQIYKTLFQGIVTNISNQKVVLATQLEDNKTRLDSLNTDSLNIIPIPLTEEWLLKYGFMEGKYQGQILVSPFETVTQGKFLGEWQVILLASVPHSLRNRIKYVHQLQNLYFALTGEELEVK